VEALSRDDSQERRALTATQEANALPFDPNAPPSFGRNVMKVVRDIIGRQ
jgi:hypothetical protein